MKTFRELKKYFKNVENATVVDEDQVIIVKNTEANKETVFFYLSYKNLQDPKYMIDKAEKYHKYKYHAMLTYVGFSSEVFKNEGINVNFEAKIDIKNMEKICCLGTQQLKMSLLYLKTADIDTYFEIIKNIVQEIVKQEKIYLVIPYGFESEPTINEDIQKLLKG